MSFNEKNIIHIINNEFDGLFFLVFSGKPEDFELPENFHNRRSEKFYRIGVFY